MASRLLEKAWEAHGGLDRWKSFENSTYNNLERRPIVEHEAYSAGFDGAQNEISH